MISGQKKHFIKTGNFCQLCPQIHIEMEKNVVLVQIKYSRQLTELNTFAIQLTY